MDRQQAVEEAARECLKHPGGEWRPEAKSASDAIGAALALGADRRDIELEMKRQRDAQ